MTRRESRWCFFVEDDAGEARPPAMPWVGIAALELSVRCLWKKLVLVVGLDARRLEERRGGFGLGAG